MSTPARSWSRMASWVASSNVSRASVWPYSPALILSSAVQNQPGKPWLPMTCVGMGGSVGLMESASAQQALRDDLAHDLGRAGGDGPEPDVAEESLHRELAHVAVASMQLHGLVGDLVRDLRGEELRHGDLGHALLAAGVERRGMVDERARSLEVGREVGHAVAQRLPGGERLAEGRPLAQVRERVLERLRGPGEREYGRHEALALEAGRELLEAPPPDADQVLRRDRALLERELGGVGGPHPHLVELAAHGEAREPALDQEPREAGVTAGRPAPRP